MSDCIVPLYIVRLNCHTAHLLTDTVRHSLELAQGQTASGRRPLDWKTLRN